MLRAANKREMTEQITQKRISSFVKSESFKIVKENEKFLEAERLEMRTNQDIESMLEFGMCPGIENYSRHIDRRKSGERPYCLVDYFPDDFLCLIDEAHVTVPQVGAMYEGDRSRACISG